MGEAARESAQRYAWPLVASRVEGVYERAIAAPEPATGTERVCRRLGLVPADGARPGSRAAAPVARPRPRGSRRQPSDRAPGRASASAGVLGVGLTLIAAQRIGVDNVVSSIVRSDSTWVLVATALMVASMFLRADSWFAIARAALPRNPLRRRDVASATMIGVLMSATLPARLGEPARAMVLSRRTGRMRETFPVLLGTLVSQTVLNIAALVVLGVVIIASTDLFHSSSERLFLFSFAPLLLLVAVLLAPSVVRQSGSGRVARAIAAIRSALVKVRTGLARLPRPPPRRRGGAAPARRLGPAAPGLLRAVHGARARQRPAIGIGAAAAVLFAVNVTAVVPATPSNIGIFQLATMSVLTTGFGVSAGRRARLRRDPPGGRDRDRGRTRPAGAGPRGRHLVGHAPARALGGPRPAAVGTGDRKLSRGAPLSFADHPERLRDPDHRSRRNHRTPRSKARCDSRDRWR